VKVILVSLPDTVDERDALIESVYPELRKYCLEKYNVQFQVCYSVLTDIVNELDLFQYSDMRWGIQSNADDDHSTEDMCFQELDQCCRLSLATNCVVSCVSLARIKN